MSQPRAIQRLCPGCDVDPPDSATDVCPSCGARLLEVRAGEDDVVGTVVDGRFEIRDRLGEGGMGTVYRAWQRSIGREIAVKLIDRKYARDVMSVRRFLREARLASQLSQPNTVSVIDFGQTQDGRLFIAMELIRGRTLEDVLAAEGKLTAARTARIGIQLCDALHAAHNLQIVHRDLKLSNVIVLDDPPGRDLIKVLDFGLAKSLTSSETQSTETGIVVGTPRYMAPEVAGGAAAAPSVDLYALGVVLAELSTGKQLWDATTWSALIAQKLWPSPVLQEVPPSLRALITRLVAAEPAERPSSASAVRSALLDHAGAGEGSVSIDDLTQPLRVAKVATPGPAESLLSTPVLVSLGDLTAPSGPAIAPSLPSIAPAVAAAPSATATVMPAPPSRRFPMMVLATIALASIAVIAVIATRGSSPAAKPQPAVTTPTTPAPVAAAIDAGTPTAVEAPAPDAGPVIPPPALEVVVHVESTPSGAAVRIAGQLRGITPIELHLPRGTTAVKLELELDGRKTSRSVVPDRDRVVDVAMPRKSGRRGGGDGGGVPF